MSKVVIFGIGQLAETVYSYLKHDSGHEIVALTVDADFQDRDTHMGLPVVPFEQVAELYPSADHAMFVAVSYRAMNRPRQQKCEQARAKGYKLISHISPRATVSPDAVVGDNCIVCEHNVLQPFVRLEDGVMMGDGNHIGHHTTVGAYTFITSHVVICGSVHVGERCFLGANSTVRDRISLGQECVIGAGALILRDAPEYSVYVGAMARRLPADSRTFADL